MNTAAFALVGRTLRMEMRSLGGMVVRTASVFILILALVFATSRIAWLGAPGLQLFWWLMIANFMLVGFVGIGAFSGVISEEREQSTLGLLRLAGFGPASILVGKSVGQLVTVTTLLAVQLPFAVIAVTLGGVSTQQVLAGYQVLLAFAFLVYGIGLFGSVRCATTAAATRLTAGLVVACLAVPPFASTIIETVAGPPPHDGVVAVLRELFDHLRSASALSALGHVLSTGFDDRIVADATWTNFALGAVATVAAWIGFGRTEIDEVASTHTSLRRRRSRPGRGPAAFRWKEFHITSGGWRAVALRFAAYGALSLVVWATTAPMAGFPRWLMFAMSLSRWMLLALAIETVLVASRVLAEEQRLRTLATVALCPMPLRRPVVAKVVATLIVLAPAALLLVGAMVLMSLPAPAVFMGSPWPTLLFCFSVLLCAAYATALVSLIARRVAVVTGFVVFVVLGFGFDMVLLSIANDYDMGQIVGAIILLFPARALHRATTLRLRRAVAE